jgi:uncharacterized protein YggE
MRTIAIAVVLLFAAPAFAQTPTSTPPVIVTNGEAVLKRMPDRALLMIATEVRDGKAANARRKSAEGMTELRAALTAAGVPDTAIRTAGFSLQPEMGRSYSGQPNVRNYVVRNQIEIRIDDLEKLADIIDAANAPRNVAVTIGSPRYELKDREAAELEAVRLAVQSAMARAKALADGAGQTLGPVLRIEQGGVGIMVPSPPPFRTQFGMADVAARGGGAAAVEAPPETPITPGEIEVRANVTVTVTIR